MTTKERAAALRTELRGRGWNARKVSVRVEYYANGSALHLTLRERSLPIALIRTVARTLNFPAEAGVHIDVNYSAEIRETMTAQEARWGIDHGAS